MKRWSDIFRRRTLDGEIREELESHLHMRAELLERAGVESQDARSQAKQMFGNVFTAQEEVRSMHINRTLDSALQDLRYAVRGLLRQPAFALATIGTIALGIGVTTAVFSAVDRVLFRSLPYPQAERLVTVGMTAPIEPNEFLISADYFLWKDRQTAFESITSWSGTAECDLTGLSPKRVVCGRTGSDFLNTLRVQPLLGRMFTADEDRPDAPPVAVMSHNLWVSRFGADRNLAGSAISLDGRETRIVGILPADFELPLSRADLLVPQGIVAGGRGGPMNIVRAFARLKPGVSVEQARDSLRPLFEESLKYVPKGFLKEVKLSVVSLQDRQTRDSKTASWLLLASVGVVLLIACANVANLLLARAAGRQRELAVRAALGAGTSRLIRQALTGSALVGLLGGAAGCALAFTLLRVFVSIAPEGIRGLSQATLDVRALLFTLAVSLGSGILFGLAPALYQPPAGLLTGSRIAGEVRRSFRHGLLVAQIAASLVLLSSAGLLLRSLWRLESVPLGMTTDHVVAVPVVLGQQTHPDPARRIAFFEELERRVSSAPGIEAYGLSDSLPPAGSTRAMIYSLIEAEGKPPAQEGTGGMVVWRMVTPGYFRALGIPMLRGRTFDSDERRQGTDAVVLNAELARRIFGTQDPVGKRMHFGRQGPWHTVVGVAGNVKNGGLELAVEPEYYLPRKIAPPVVPGSPPPPESQRRAAIVVRTTLQPSVAGEWIRGAIAELDRTLPVEVELMSQRVSRLAERPRFNTMLLSFFALAGLLLAAVGLYGVVSYLVAERTQEIGVRVALGATQTSIIGLMIRHAATWTGLGALIGLAGSAAVARALRTLLFDTPPWDPWPIFGALAILALVTFAAAWLPARRASRLDPVAALRL